MKKTLYTVAISLVLLGGAPFALADVLDPSVPQPFSFSCGPYQSAFAEGGYYVPTNGGPCTFTFPNFASSSVVLSIYNVVSENSVKLTPLNGDFITLSGGPFILNTPGIFFSTSDTPPLAGDSFFSVAYGADSDAQILAADAYLRTGAGSPPPNLNIIHWKWGYPLTVTADNQTMTEGNAIPALTATLSGFVDGDTAASSDIGGSASCSTIATQSSVAGDYPITCTQGGLSSTKYAFASFVGGTLHITSNQVALTVTAVDASTVYGSVIQTLGAVLSGFINGDTASSSTSGAPDCTTTATSASPVGSYPITCTVGTLASQNYSFGSFFPGLFTVLPAPLTMTADDKTMAAGSAVPLLTATLSGFVNGESFGTSGVSGFSSCSTSATSASLAGSYPITCTVGSLVANNYTFTTFIDGTLVVTAPVGPTVTITNPIANQVYTKSDSIMLAVAVLDTVPIVATTTLFNGVPFNPSQPIPFFTASPGTSTVTVTVLDANGLSATASVSFLITRPGGDQCFSEAEGWWNRGWVWTSDDFYHVLIDCSDLDHFHRDRHDLENDHNRNSDWKKHNDDISKGVKDRNDDMDKRIHKNSR